MSAQQLRKELEQQFVNRRTSDPAIDELLIHARQLGDAELICHALLIKIHHHSELCQANAAQLLLAEVRDIVEGSDSLLETHWLHLFHTLSGNVLDDIADYEGSIASHELALQIATDADYVWGRRVSNLNLGFMQHQLGNLSESVEYYFRSHSADDPNDMLTMTIRKHVGEALAGQGLYEQALTHYEQTDHDVADPADSIRISLANARSLAGLGRFDEAEASVAEFDQWAADNVDRGLTVNHGEANLIRSIIAVGRSSFDEARHLAVDGLTQYRSIGLIDRAPFALAHCAEAALAQSDNDTALLEAEQVYLQTTNPNVRRRALKVMSCVARQRGDIALLSSCLDRLEGELNRSAHDLSQIMELQERLYEANVARVRTEALQHRLDELTALEAVQREVMGVVAHDLRSPMQVIEIVLGQAAFDADDVHLGKVGELALAHMVAIVEQITATAKIEGGQDEPTWVNIDLTGLVKNRIDQVRLVARQRSIDLDIVLDAPPQPIALLADPTRVDRALDNLMINAVRYTPIGGTLFVSLDHSDDEARISVRDEGPGLDEEQRNRLFQKFGRLGNQQISQVGAGIGLGLYNSQKMLESIGGNIEAHSDGPGKGSTFTVVLRHPSADTPDAPA